MSALVLAGGVAATTPEPDHRASFSQAAGPSSSPFSFPWPPVGPDGWPLLPPRPADLSPLFQGQTPASRNPASAVSSRSTPSRMGQLAIWNAPAASTPQNQLAPSRLIELTPWSGQGGDARGSIATSGFLDEMRADEAKAEADARRLQRMQEEREAAVGGLHDLLMGDAYEQLLARRVLSSGACGRKNIHLQFVFGIKFCISCRGPQAAVCMYQGRQTILRYVFCRLLA